MHQFRIGELANIMTRNVYSSDLKDLYAELNNSCWATTRYTFVWGAK
jgi:hypothetical protein